jgi:Gas vesicle synthesis protein GvpL/GvpF
MSLLVYGIVEAGDIDPSGRGLDDRPLFAIAEGPLEAIVTEHQGRTAEPTAAHLSIYERTIRALMDRGAILPAQFGSVLPDEDAVRALLEARRRDLLARLGRVRGAVEIGLRASWREGAGVIVDPRPSSGSSYLRDRLELRQSARRLASELDSLRALARGIRRALVPRPDLPVLDAYLVDREHVGEFVAMVEQLDDRLEDVELVCTGPWPPYSFSEGAPL